MTYNDFPILDDQHYALLNSHYSNKQDFNRVNTAHKLFTELFNTKTVCSAIPANFNTKIKLALNDCYLTLNKLTENISTTFNIDPPSIKSIKSCSIFTLIKKLLSLLKLFNEWQTNEIKEYYKNIATKSLDELFCEADKLLTAINESNVYIFKHM